MQRDQVAAYDALRDGCPVVYGEAQGWSLLRHAEALAAMSDPVKFSSAVSAHVAVPDGMAGGELAACRAVIDRCFTPSRVSGFTPALAAIGEALLTAARVRPGDRAGGAARHAAAVPPRRSARAGQLPGGRVH